MQHKSKAPDYEAEKRRQELTERDKHLKSRLEFWENTSFQSREHQIARGRILARMNSERFAMAEEYRELLTKLKDSADHRTKVRRYDRMTDPMRYRVPGLQIKQEILILDAISKLGLVRQALPLSLPGRCGVKREVFDYVKDNPVKIEFSKRVFDKAWERLQVGGLIVEAAS